ncbi:MAG: ABC transporter permease subunit [Planctomycetota bacterium]
MARGAAIALVLVLIAIPVAGVLAIVIDPPPAGIGEAPPLDLGAFFGRTEADGSYRLGPLPRTLGLALAVCSVAMLLGTSLAWLGARAEYRGRRILTALGLVPFAVPSYLLGMTHRELFGAASFHGFWPAVLVLGLATSPFAQVLVGAALARLGGSGEEAARLLGAGPLDVFRRILLPRLRPTLAYAFLLILLYTISDFGVVDILDCEVLTWSLFRAFNQQALELAAAMGLGLVAIALPLVLAARWLHGRAAPGRGTGQPRPAARVKLSGAPLALAYAIHVVQLGLGVALPAWTLLGWIFPAAFRPEAWDFGLVPLALEPLATSLVLAAVTTVVAILLAFIPAWTAARRGLRGGFVETAIYAGQALPGVLVAFGLFEAILVLSRRVGRSWHDDLRQAGVLIALGLGLRFLGQCYGALKAAILRLDRRQEESARSLGAAPRRVFLAIQLPSLRPGLASAALLAALGVVKELPITLMLLPREITPLSYRLYGRYTQGNFLEAGVVGVTMAATALVLHAVAQSWARRAGGTART